MAYSESDTRAKLIDPKIKSSQWLESNIVREYYFTDGRKLIGGKRGKRYFVDYLLVYKNTNLAIVEAKAQEFKPSYGKKDGVKEIGSDKLSSPIKLSGIDRTELKEAFAGAGNIREGYLGLQREIYR